MVAALVAAKSQITVDALVDSVKALLSGEDISDVQIDASIERLVNYVAAVIGKCHRLDSLRHFQPPSVGSKSGTKPIANDAESCNLRAVVSR